MKYTNRADLLIAAGESIKMQEKAYIEPVFKFDSEKRNICMYNFDYPERYDYEFPLAVVEGKPVFVGDELWNVPNNFKFEVSGADVLCDRIRILGGKLCAWIEDASWNPPKPKTVMVELLREDAEFMVKAYGDMWSNGKTARIADCCRKALEKQ